MKKQLKSNQQIVKVNAENEISILTLENGKYEIAHLLNGEYSETILNDVVTCDEWDLDKEVSDIVSQIVAESFGGDVETDEQVIIEDSTYQIWIAPSFVRGELSYGVSTIHDNNHDKDDMDTNSQTRKTWKGLANYIRRFSK